MILAVAGKGGAGKTTISATLCRLAARRGAAVVAVDADSNPNLAVALGLDDDARLAASPLPPALVSRRPHGPALTEPVGTVLDRLAVAGPDGVRVLQMGMPQHADEGCLCAAHAAVGALLADLSATPATVTVVDLEASPEHLGRGTARHADVLLLVAEPYYRSLETVRRQAALAAELPIGRVAVALNKARRPADADAAAALCANHGLELVGVIPWSDDVLDADGRRASLVDAAPGGAAVAAIDALIDGLALLAPHPT